MLFDIRKRDIESRENVSVDVSNSGSNQPFVTAFACYCALAVPPEQTALTWTLHCCKRRRLQSLTAALGLLVNLVLPPYRAGGGAIN